jgi:nucleotide-binding universal stress UspA family protein
MVVDAANYLTQVAGRLDQGGASVHSNVITGRVEDRIIDYAKEEKVDLIIMATHGRSGVSRWVRGSVADKVLRMAHIPVLMVRAPGTGRA